MRCPKCGYISFDHMDTCLKCKKDISKGSDVEGTTYHATAPSFLRVPEISNPEDEFEVDSEIVEEDSFSFEADDDDSIDEFEFTDPELDVLVEEDANDEEDKEEGSISFDNQDFGGDFQLDSDTESDEEGGFDFDFNEDDDAPASAAFDVPDELADITDLAPPDEKNSPIASLSTGMTLSLDDDMSLDEDLHLDGLDLDLGLSSNNDTSETELSLSLDDIDLSSEDILDGRSELDDLNLNLDLDGLGAAPAKKKEEDAGSLDGISLSLD